MTSGIQQGDPIVVVLQTPKEKYWGVLDEISTAGVFLRGLDLNAFDDWLAAVLHKEPFIGLTDLFFPMWRIERVSKDEAAGSIASLYEQVERRTGLTVGELLRDQE
ncbi:MAG: hypothetical protein WAL47_20510 [Pyrinomonadaceae bacterium]